MFVFRTLTRLFFVFVCFLFFTQNTHAQLEFKLQWLEAEEQWGVFVRPLGSIQPSPNTIAAGGQISINAPLDFEFTEHENHGGLWLQNSQVVSPDENVDRQYVFFGLQLGSPSPALASGEETLLITFGQTGTDCPDTLSLIDENDPFLVFPNSASINPGNDLSVFDTVGGGTQYFFSGTYDLDAWNCHPTMTGTKGLLWELLPIEIFPNPFSESFEIQIPEMILVQHLTFELFDLNGKLVEKSILKEGKNIGLGKNLVPGFFFYKITDELENTRYSGKILKE